MIIKDGHIITERFHGTVPINSKFNGDKLVWSNKYSYRLPVDYQEVEYIKSDGNSWIDTKLVFDENTSVKIELSLVRNNDGGTYILGGRKTYIDRDYTISVSRDGTLLNIFGSHSFITSEFIGDNVRFILFKDKNKLYRDGNLINVLEEDVFTTPVSVYLFNAHISGTITSGNKPMVGKMYSCLIYKNDVCVGNFVPCYRKSDHKTGMYDTITNRFFSSVSGVDFLAGDDVKCNKLEYIESKGDQYINLHLIPKTTHSFSTKVKITDKSIANNMILGSRTTGTYQTSDDQIYMNWQKVDKRIVLRNRFNSNVIYFNEGSNGFFDLKKVQNENCQLDNPKIPYFVFALNKLGEPDAFACCRMYFLEIYDNDVLAMNLIPYKIGSRIGLLDTISKVHFTGEIANKPFTND